jgi:diguanylate cyclase (GGDEF)-like protein
MRMILPRTAGEEFLIVFPSSTEEGALRQAERIRKAIESAPVRAIEGEIAVTASFGVVTSDSRHLQDAGELIRAADAALYRAKELGRNRVERAEPLEASASKTSHVPVH